MKKQKEDCAHEWKTIYVNDKPSKDGSGNVLVHCTKCHKISKGGK